MPVHLRGPLTVVLAVEQHPERVVSAPVPRLELNGPFHDFQRFVDATEPVEDLATVRMWIWVYISRLPSDRSFSRWMG